MNEGDPPVRLSKKLVLVGPGIYRHWCPGCKCGHDFYTKEPAPRTKAMWIFNGNVDFPTFTHSMHITVGPIEDPEEPEWNMPKTTLCHYILTVGVLNFLGDCQHALKGQQVLLPDMPEEV